MGHAAQRGGQGRQAAVIRRDLVHLPQGQGQPYRCRQQGRQGQLAAGRPAAAPGRGLQQRQHSLLPLSGEGACRKQCRCQQCRHGRNALAAAYVAAAQSEHGRRIQHPQAGVQLFQSLVLHGGQGRQLGGADLGFRPAFHLRYAGPDGPEGVLRGRALELILKGGGVRVVQGHVRRGGCGCPEAPKGKDQQHQQSLVIP